MTPPLCICYDKGEDAGLFPCPPLSFPSGYAVRTPQAWRFLRVAAVGRGLLCLDTATDGGYVSRSISSVAYSGRGLQTEFEPGLAQYTDESLIVQN